ncbi:unnamed protein product [Diamesa hyperborea]
MKLNCTTETRNQIAKEIQASVKYLTFGAYFAQDNINRPGFAKFFFNAAAEEREHAFKLMEYLQMRGKYIDMLPTSEATKFDFTKLIKEAKNFNGDASLAVNPTDGLSALKLALKMEVYVTESIRNLIKFCEKDSSDVNDVEFNHYHFVDYLTGEFLEEQYNGQRELAGKIATLGKMRRETGSMELAEFLFDKKHL